MTLLKMATQNGYGCWYCGGKEGEDLVFSIEFDTPVHKSCAYGALNRNKHDQEAQIFVNEFDE